MTMLDPTAAAALLEAAFNAPLPSQPEPPIVTPPTAEDGSHGYRWLRPLVEAADEFAAQARTLGSGQRVYTGIQAFDDAMRGLAPKELMVVQGYAHSGKTLFVTEMLRHNHDRPIALFTADEDRVLVLTKLTSLVTGISAEVLEKRIADGDAEAERIVRSTAIEHFPKLVVFDQVSELRRMTDALAECRDWWGEREAFTVFDYANLLQYEGDVVSKIDAIKGWAKDQSTPMVLMHQSSRSKGSDGGEVTIDSGSHGGEQQATFVVGVRRKRNFYRGQLRELQEKRANALRGTEAIDDKIREVEWELQRHVDTITLNLVKNKRPPGRLVDDLDFHLDADTGRITPADDLAFARTSPIGSAPVGGLEGRRAQFEQTMFESSFPQEEPF